jgi:hypothetical protein
MFLRYVAGKLQMQLLKGPKFWQRGQRASAISLILMLAPVSLSNAQQVEVRSLCSLAPPIPKAAQSTAYVPEVAPIEVAKVEVDKNEVAQAQIERPEVAKAEIAQIAVAPIEIATTGGCPTPSPIGVRYNPEITAQIRRQYEDSLVHAAGVTQQQIVSNVILSNQIPDLTTPPPILYFREGDRVPAGTYATMEECQARRDAGGKCIRSDGSIFISLTGGIRNQNPFPLGSVTIQCDYLDVLGIPKSSVKQSRYTIGPGGYIPYQDEVIDVLPPRSVVKDISCHVESAEIWQKTDDIQYHNAPLNPKLAPSAPALVGSSLVD